LSSVLDPDYEDSQQLCCREVLWREVKQVCFVAELFKEFKASGSAFSRVHGAGYMPIYPSRNLSPVLAGNNINKFWSFAFSTTKQLTQVFLKCQTTEYRRCPYPKKQKAQANWRGLFALSVVIDYLRCFEKKFLI
jgi:hypothetical protein